MKPLTLASDHRQSDDNATSEVPQLTNSARSFKPVLVDYVGKDAKGESSLTIVNTSGNGKRLLFASKLIEHIGIPSEVQIALDEEGIAVSSNFQGIQCTPLKLRKLGKKYCVYSSQLIDVVCSHFELDFNGKTSYSFPLSAIELLNHEGIPTAFVKVRGEKLQQ